jgi:hypothetical protein
MTEKVPHFVIGKSAKFGGAKNDARMGLAPGELAQALPESL